MVFATVDEYTRWANEQAARWQREAFAGWKRAAVKYRGRGRRGTKQRKLVAWNLRWFHRWAKQAGVK